MQTSINIGYIYIDYAGLYWFNGKENVHDSWDLGLRVCGCLMALVIGQGGHGEGPYITSTSAPPKP